MFSLLDGVLTVTVINGPKKDRKVEIRSGEKVAFDPGLKATPGKGPGGTVYVAQGAGEPKVSIDCSSAREVGAKVFRMIRYQPRAGRVRSAQVLITHVFRNEIGSMSFKYMRCTMSAGGGYDADDSGVKGKLEFLPEQVDLSVDGSAYERIV